MPNGKKWKCGKLIKWYYDTMGHTVIPSRRLMIFREEKHKMHVAQNTAPTALPLPPHPTSIHFVLRFFFFVFAQSEMLRSNSAFLYCCIANWKDEKKWKIFMKVEIMLVPLSTPYFYFFSSSFFCSFGFFIDYYFAIVWKVVLRYYGDTCWCILPLDCFALLKKANS